MVFNREIKSGGELGIKMAVYLQIGSLFDVNKK